LNLRGTTIWIGIFASFFLPRSSAGELGTFSVDVSVDVMIAMRDGVKLATDIYRPAQDGKPIEGKSAVILTRTPYDKKEGKSADARYFASHGYTAIVQDTRGRYDSEGVWRWLLDDGFDGVDTAAWIAAQSWSNGRIGMMGTSYVGGTQHALATSGSPFLRTVIPVDAVSNMGRQSMRNGGAFELRFWNWIMLNAGKGSSASQDPSRSEALTQMAEQRHAYIQNLPLRRGTTPLKLAPEYETWLIEAMRHGANDEFWRQNNIVDYPESYQDIPVYLVGGWYDSWAGNTTANFMVLSKQLKSDVYLIMGPWIHGAQNSSSHGQVSFGKEAAILDPLAWRKEWFDHWLRDLPNSVGREAPFRTKVRIFVMGTGDGSKSSDNRLMHGGYWREENEWPLARTELTPYYLKSNGLLSKNIGRQVGEAEGSTSYTFDPKDPVPTIGGNISSGNDILLQGGWDQRGGEHVWNFQKPIPLSSRNDVLVFQTEPLADDVEVTGEIEVKLWISSTASDTDFTAKLIDVYPPSLDFPGGFDLNIGDGIQRARFRDSLKHENMMKPGEIYPLTVKLYPSSNVFKRGHRIRVDVSSSNFPRFDVNPNTGEPLADHRRIQIAVNTIHHNAAHPSHILLPIIPRSP
jgi:putative CocE/NonD family hydrolase